MSIKRGCTWGIGIIVGAGVGLGALALAMILFFTASMESCVGR